jgi:AcrR family transcriptional regulator
MTQTGDKTDTLEELEATVGPEPAVAPEGAGPAGAPARTDVKDKDKDTRERILDVALDLFTEQGYDGTSLRQIAEQLSITKAAIYYYFESKEDILMALHMRLHEFGREALLIIGETPVTLELWEQLLDQILGQMMSQRKIFLMHERNQAALEKLHREEHDAEHDDIQDKFRQILADPRLPLRDRVRMACSFGAVFAGLFMSGDAFAQTSNQELGDLLVDAVHDILSG